MDQLTLWQEDTLANHLVLPGSEKARMMTATSGQKCIDYSKKLTPRWFIGENVAGHVTLGLDTVLSDLERINYSWQAFIIPASAVNAPHRRNRVFVVTNSTSNRLPAGSKYFRFLSKDVESDTRTWNGELLAEPGIQRVVNGVPTEMDKDRLKALGNAVVPQQIYPIFKAIAEIERSVINV